MNGHKTKKSLMKLKQGLWTRKETQTRKGKDAKTKAKIEKYQQTMIDEQYAQQTQTNCLGGTDRLELKD